MTASETALASALPASRRALGYGAAALIAVSATLQGLASLERWGARRDSWDRPDISPEDGVFDYWWPADPWENLGVAAQLYGAGLLVLASGIGCLVLAAAGARGLRAVLLAACAGPPGLLGLHALVSGLLGFPTPVLGGAGPAAMLLGAAQSGGLVCLAIVAARASAGWATGAVLLIGTTVFGYLVALFGIAPAIVGYQSHDTTPFTETVVAGWAAASAAAVAIGTATRRRRHRLIRRCWRAARRR